MEETLLIEKRQQAEKFFNSRFKMQTQLKSDFGAYCVEQWLTGRNIQTSFLYLAIDYLRAFGGVPTKRSSKDMLSYGQRLHTDDQIESGLQLIAPEEDLFQDFRFKLMLENPNLRQNERIVLFLYFKWGLILDEIAEVFGVTESRASQILRAALQKQKEYVTRKE